MSQTHNLTNFRPMVRLGSVLSRTGAAIEADPSREYSEITVRLWGKGVVERGRVSGAQINGRRYVAKTGNFIASRIDARNGAMGLVPESLDGGLVTNDFPLFQANKERLDLDYLGWLSRTAGFVELCLRASEGTTNRVRLKEDRFLALEIPLPPLPEQRRIVVRVEGLAAQIDEARRLRKEAVEEAEALYAKQLESLMSPHDDGWIRAAVADLIKSMDAGWSPQCDDVPVVGDEWGVLKTTSIQWCEFQPSYNKRLPATLLPRAELVVRKGDVLVTRAGPRKRVAVVAAVREDHPRLTISDKLIRLRVLTDKIEARFLEQSLCSPFSQEHLIQRKTGLADAQVNISQKILLETPVAYPPLSEQRRIVAELDALQAELATLKRLQTETAAELDALLPTILDRAFKGEL
jgi:type I restriction enzyme S subunit